MELQFTVLERETAAEQVRRFAEVDVLMPPYWYLACYRRLAEDAAIGYKMLRATGKKGPQCDKNPQSLLCQQKGIRDRDFNTSIPDVVRTVTSARSFVFRKKYHVML